MRRMHRARQRGGISPRRPRLDRARFGDDSGMTLIELMWALMIFAIAATGVAYGIMTATNTVRLNKDRVQAANLASREMEITRSEFMNSSTGATDLGATSLTVNPHPLPTGTSVDLTTYTVTRNVEWIPAGAGTSACDGGATVQYPSLLVTVTVTWPRMGSVKPVESRTVLTPPKNSLNSNLAFVGIKVLRADGTPAVGQAVSLSGPSSSTRYTAEDGCAVFSLSSFGTYTAGLSTSGYVDNFGATAPTKTIVASAGTLSQASFYYDKAATLTTTFQAPSGYVLPVNLPKAFTLYNTGITPSGTKAVTTSSATTTVTNLWPFSDGYAMWPGSCTQSDPVKAGGARAANTVIAPGDSGTSTMTFSAVKIRARNSAGTALANATIVVNPVSATGCLAPENSGWLIGTTDSSGILMTSLPAGSWTVSVNGKSPLSAWPVTGNLVPGGTVPTVTAQISTTS